MNAALIALAERFEATKPGYVKNAEQTRHIMDCLTRDYVASADAIRALIATGIFDGPYVPGVRTIAKTARQIV